MNAISRDHLHAYLDDALSDAETSKLEQQLRSDEALRTQLRDALQERDRGEHSLGAVWRRERLTCPSREQLGSFMLEVLDPEHQDYVEFHLKVIGCPFCVANLADIQEHQMAPQSQQRRKRYFHSSAGLLQKH